MPIRLAVIIACVSVAGCHTRSLAGGGGAPDCSTTAHAGGDLALPAVVDMGYAPPIDARDLGGAASGDMTPSPESFIRCRGTGGAPEWVMATDIDPFLAALDIVGSSGQYGVVFTHDVTQNLPGWQRVAARVTGVNSGGTLMTSGSAYFDWTLSGTADVDVATVASAPTGQTAVLLYADAAETLTVGGMPVTTSAAEGLVASYDISNHLVWLAHLGNLPAIIIARALDGSVFTAAVITGDKTPYTVDYGFGPIKVGATDLVVVGKIDGTGKLVSVTPYDLGGTGVPGGSTSSVRRMAVDGNGAVWISFQTFVANAPHSGVVVMPASGAPIRREYAAAGDIFVAASADGHIAVAQAAIGYQMSGPVTVELWANATSRVWQHVSTGGGYASVRGLGLDAMNDVIVAGSVESLPATPAAFAFDLGGGPLAAGVTRDVGYLFVVKYAADGSHVWSKLRSDNDAVQTTYPSFGGRLGVDDRGGAYLFSATPEPTVCGKTVTSQGVRPNARYLLKLAP